MKEPRLDIVDLIWTRSKGQHFSYAWINRTLDNRFHEFFGVRAAVQSFGEDLYFSACGFTQKKRSNETWAPSAVLFADLDEAVPFDLNPAPTYAWRTSPRMYQAVWFLDRFITDYQEWAQLNKAMTLHTNADTGGWQGSKLLRVPGTLNFKRADVSGVPLGDVVIWNPDAIHSVGTLKKILPDVSVRARRVSDDHPPLGMVEDRTRLMRRYWDAITLRGRSMLTTSNVNDRSLHIVRTIHELLNGGLDAETTFHLVWVQPWCKWRTDRNDPERLWEEVLLAQS